jgi:hypothetical protein
MAALIQPLVQFLLLSAISCFSLLLSLSFYLKSRALRRVSENSSISVYNKTFNVISPYPGHRQSMYSAWFLLPFACGILAFVLAVAMWKVFEMGLVTVFVAFIIWLGLLMVDSAVEIYRSANIFIKAIKGKVDLGKGDLVALLFLKKTMPRLSAYYLWIAVGFFVFSFMASQVVPTALSLLSQGVGPLLEVPTSIGIAGVYAGPLAVAVVTVSLLVSGGAIKNKILGSVASMPLTTLEEQFERVHAGSHAIMTTCHEKQPYESLHRPSADNAESEE